jgi:UDPglucose 6-dehydrogenase
MRIAIIGTGYVGLVSGACFSDFGHDVICVDKDEEKIAALDRGEMPIFEPGLDRLVARNVAAGRLSFTTAVADGVRGAEAIFIAVGTPSRRGDGHADLSYVYGAAREIGALLAGSASTGGSARNSCMPAQVMAVHAFRRIRLRCSRRRRTRTRRCASSRQW